MQRHPDAHGVFTAFDDGQGLAFARPGNAFAVLDQKQRPMRSALDQACTAVQKLIGLPFQGNAAMRAAVFVDEHLALAAHGKQRMFAQLEAFAVGFGQVA